MSLINDALKRAKQAHPKAPETIPVGPLMQAAHRAPQSSGSWPVLTLTLLLGAVLTLTVLLAWQSTNQSVRVVHAPGVSTQEQAASIGVLPAPAPVVPAPAPSTTAAAGQAPSTVQTLLANVPSTPIHARDPAPAGEAAPVVVTVPQAPAPLKLQGLVYRPSGASAVVSGKTVYVGDRVSDARVTAIARDSVTLNRNGETIVLSLD